MRSDFIKYGDSWFKQKCTLNFLRDINEVVYIVYTCKDSFSVSFLLEVGLP